MPKLRLNVISKMYYWQQERERNASVSGIEGARRAREHLRQHAQNDEKKKEDLLLRFIEHEPRAFNASNLQRLLTKKWNEESNSYKIDSKLTPKKEKRVKLLLLEDRYG